TGAIGEVLMYDRALNFEDRENVERYLVRKWLGRTPEPDVSSFGNLVTWLDASALDTLDTMDGHVVRWNSRRGLERQFTASETDLDTAPVVRMDGLNGQPVVHFDGNDELVLPTTFLQNGDQYTVVVVGRYDEGSDEGGILYAVNGSNQPGFRMRMSNALGLRATHTSPPSLSGGDFVEVDAAGLGDAFRAITTRTAQRLVMGLRTAERSGDMERNVTQANLANLTYVLGGTRADSDHTIDQLTGDIAEVIIFRHALAGEERTQLERYLESKWGF
ncbi:MAG: hypothetical protein AAF411_30275, partial [Myxococcota bacterium]